MKDSQIKLSDGRTLAYTDIGDSSGPCAFSFHGAPSSRVQLNFLDEQFAAQGLRIVSPDRPGYGGSSPQPGRTLADWPADVAELADALGVERFVVIGGSSGGPYSVACCALLPEQVRGGIVVAGAVDMSWPEARKGYPQVELDIMDSPDEDAAIAWCAERFGEDGSGFLESEPFEWPEPDTVLLADEAFNLHVQEILMEAFRQGVGGYVQDIFVQGRPWPFDSGGVSVRVDVLHGELDRIVPVEHSRHTAETIPLHSSMRFPVTVTCPLCSSCHVSFLSLCARWIEVVEPSHSK